jgi:hypothetical protein
MSKAYESKDILRRGKGQEKEIQEFFKASSIQRLKQDAEARIAVIELREINTQRRMQDQRDLDADYRNYVMPV